MHRETDSTDHLPDLYSVAFYYKKSDLLGIKKDYTKVIEGVKMVTERHRNNLSNV